MKTVSGHSRVLKIAALALAFTVTQAGLIAQTVNIPDPNLKAAIREALQKPSGDITVADMESLTLLDARGRDILNISGLEKASNLTDLQLGLWDYHRVNRITDLSPLAGLSNLTRLGLDYNNVSDLRPLAGLTNLETLRMYRNPITDLGPLAGLTNLGSLWLNNDQFTDLSPLAELTNLTVLHVVGKAITDLSPLTGLSNLNELSFAGELTTDFSPLAGLTNLEDLTLWGDQISALASLTYLKRLTIWGNNVSDLSPLAGLTNLEDLYLWEKDISDLTPLSSLTNLKSLNLNSNRISDLNPLASLTNLQFLSLNWNRISDLSPLAGLTNLAYLWLGGNQISDVSPLVDLTNIGKLDISHNYIDITPGSPSRQIIDSLNAIEGLTVEFEPQNEPEPLMGGIPIAGQEDWCRSDWWGTYCTTFAPWLYHTEHGFIYRAPSSTTEGMYVYDDALDTWCWTSEEVYPAVYAFNPGADNQGVNIIAAWLWYFKDTRTPRSFRVLTGPSATQTLFFGP